MKRIEKARTDECLNPSAIPLSTRRVFRSAALVAVLAVMPFLVFTGCKQPDNDTSQPNRVEPPEWTDDKSVEGTVDTFSKELGDKDHRSVVQAIREAAKKDVNHLTLNLWVRHEDNVELRGTSDIAGEGLTLYNKAVGNKEKNSPAKITIEGNRAIVNMINDNPTYGGCPLITVGNGVTLTLRDITFKGPGISKGEPRNNAPLIKVENGGTLIMDNDVVITGNENFGGGGGGVRVEDGGTFEMREGKIHGNKAQNGGGVYIVGNASKFIMDGGEISGNEAVDNGGGVYVENGKFESSIVDISGNTAVNNGGGVYVAGGKFSIIFGTKISGNAAGENGGGVYVAGGEFDMNVGDISGNNVTHKDGNGGGVYVAGGTFEMKSGSISGNSINPIDYTDYHANPDQYPTGLGKGPGVYVENGGKFSKTGGTINGLIKEAEEEWETKDVQNYYQRPVGNNEDDSDRCAFDASGTGTPGGAGRGYAVYDDTNNTTWDSTVGDSTELDLSGINKDVSEEYKLSPNIDPNNSYNPSGIEITSAIENNDGDVFIVLGGTVSGGVTGWAENNVFGPAGDGIPSAGDWSWVTIDGILTPDAQKADTVIKQTNQALRYYAGSQYILGTEPNDPPDLSNPIYISPDDSVAYKLKKYAANGAQDTGDGGCSLLLWSEANPKSATLEITPAGKDKYTIYVDWSDVTFQ